LVGSGDIDVQYLSADGTVLTREGSAPLPVDDADLALASGRRRGVELFRDDEIEGEAVRMLTVGLGGGRGAVQGVRSIEEMNRVLASLGIRILMVTIGVATAAAVAGVLIGGSVTRRLLRLTGVAEEVAETGALDAAVPAEGSDEVARLGRAFNDMLTALARSEAEQARLVQDVGHELRTPMTSLRTNIFTLRGFPELDESTRRDVIADLEGETEELSSLIEEVLEVSSGVSEEEPLTNTEVGGLVAAVAERTAGRWNRSVSLEVCDAVWMDLSERQVARAVRNLVDNACKFSPDGSPIEVVVRRGGSGDGEYSRIDSAAHPLGTEMVEVAVLDRGPGFEEADTDAVFGRFHRSAAARSMPGSGLGLSIVAAVAEAHGGGVRADNREGGGARVMMWLPLHHHDGASPTNRR
jgi:two-component system sensor histidine kinase MprB